MLLLASVDDLEGFQSSFYIYIFICVCVEAYLSVYKLIYNIL